jgi:type II secretory pathway pseudopilin PulG
VTLIEMAVTLAIIGIVMALSFATLSQLGDWADPQSAASDLSGALSLARARAVERGSDVWLILYEDIDRNGSAAQGNGAYFLLEDRLFNFKDGTGAPAGSLTYIDFQPPNRITPLPAQGMLMESKYLDSYSFTRDRSTVRFGASGTLSFDAPFTGLTPSACSFCDGSPRRGAVVFDQDGSARFYKGDGTPVTLAGGTVGQRSAALGLLSTDGRREYLFAISGPVGFIGMQRR